MSDFLGGPYFLRGRTLFRSRLLCTMWQTFLEGGLGRKVNPLPRRHCRLGAAELKPMVMRTVLPSPPLIGRLVLSAGDPLAFLQRAAWAVSVCQAMAALVVLVCRPWPQRTKSTCWELRLDINPCLRSHLFKAMSASIPPFPHPCQSHCHLHSLLFPAYLFLLSRPYKAKAMPKTLWSSGWNWRLKVRPAS